MLDWLPENISTYGGAIDHVIRTIYYIVGAWFVLAEVVFLFFIFKYRRRPGRSATYQPGTSLKALAWILLPVALILGFDLAIEVVQAPVWEEIKQQLPIADYKVRVRGRQFVWDITHPGADGQFDSADDIQAVNQLVVPVNRKIVFELEAADVIHSLWIPHLRLKQDAVPGRTIRGWFEATQTGVFPLACAELCGSGHGMMKGELHVLNQPDFEKWVKEETAALLEVP
ncbi:MAG: cytochrome c oxidase subunit II [Deltaproteobacteria bacterium]|nr:cytochrome c oxidase subunit II [Deltaproteobacteria bacterium]MBI2501368.1 cytochrome c oxidase subunit II [Deltaproteobacteria bacterium]